MTTIRELERRVSALETAQNETAKTQEWMAAKLGRIAAVQDEHTEAIAELKVSVARLENNVARIESNLGRVEKKVDDFIAHLPAIVAEAVREGLRKG